MLYAGGADTHRIRDVVERSFGVVEERIALRGEGIREDVGPAVVVVVGEVRTHSRETASVRIVGGASFERDLLERAVASIAKQLLRHRVVRHKDVWPAVAIEV